MTQTDFTIDCYYCCRALSSSSSIRLGTDLSLTAQLGFNFRYEGGILILVGNSSLTGWDKLIQTNVLLPLDSLYHHIAFTYSQRQLKIFIDGTLVYSNTTISLNSKAGDYITVIIDRQNSIDEVRVSNIARWTSDFTPPVKPY